jgi:hypothetical protein
MFLIARPGAETPHAKEADEHQNGKRHQTLVPVHVRHEVGDLSLELIPKIGHGSAQGGTNSTIFTLQV